MAGIFPFALSPYWEGSKMMASQLANPLPGYVNQSDGSVGILGKAFGSLGIDAEGRRAATRWGDAWRNSVDPDTTGRTASLLPIRGDGGYGVPTLISQPFESFEDMWARGDEANISNTNALAASSINSLDVGGGAMTGGLAAGLAGAVPEGAVAANGIGRKASGYDARVARLREQSQTIARDDGASAGTPFEYVDLNSTNPDAAKWIRERAGAGPRSEQAYVDLAPLKTLQSEIFPARASDFALGYPDDGFLPSVYRLPSGEHVITDGNHRLSAAAMRGSEKALVDLFYANSPTGSSVPLAFTDYDEQPRRPFGRIGQVY